MWARKLLGPATRFILRRGTGAHGSKSMGRSRCRRARRRGGRRCSPSCSAAASPARTCAMGTAMRQSGGHHRFVRACPFPDCSGQFCPAGPAFSSKAYSVDVAHSAAECSNRGICDRATSVCECLEGFIGDAFSSSVGCPPTARARAAQPNYAGLAYGPDTRAGYVPGGDGLGPLSATGTARCLSCACVTGASWAPTARCACAQRRDPDDR